MHSEHTFKQYDAELESLRGKVLEMGGLVEQQIVQALEALVKLDPNLAKEVMNNDHRVNTLEVQIDEDCSHIIARRQPTAGDLRMVMMIVKTITDLERELSDNLELFEMSKEDGDEAGLITIEDVLEQIVGDIEDEYDYDEDEDNIIQNADGQYRVKALTEISDFNEIVGTALSDEEFSTIGGLVVNRFGHLPKRDDEITFDGLHIKVLRADSRRLHSILVEVMPTAGETAE